MVNPFPILLDFGLLAPLLIRVIAGYFALRNGWHGIRTYQARKKNVTAEQPKNFAVLSVLLSKLEFLGGILLILGLFTQIDALVLGLVIVIRLLGDTKLGTTRGDADFLLFAMYVSLVLSGAGLFALDLPL
jgi:putative oxidoreductase